jgi:hypothetical protein
MTEPRWLITDGARERLHRARRTGELCAACGKPLGAGDPVFLERFQYRMTRLDGSIVFGSRGRAQGPVCTGCASPEILGRSLSEQPERCDGCGRPVYYPGRRRTRRRALCSRRCAGRANIAARLARSRPVT